MDCKEIKPVNPKGNHPEYSLEGLMLKLKLQYIGHLMRRANSLEKTRMLGKIDTLFPHPGSVLPYSLVKKKKKLSTTKHTCTSVGHARNPSSSHFLYLSDPKLPAYSISPTTLLSPSFCRLMFFKLYVHFSYLGDLVRFRF